MSLNSRDKKFSVLLAIMGILVMISSELVPVNEYKFQHYFVFVIGIILSVSSISMIVFYEK